VTAHVYVRLSSGYLGWITIGEIQTWMGDDLDELLSSLKLLKDDPL
jgi:hypothetical protein